MCIDSHTRSAASPPPTPPLFPLLPGPIPWHRPPNIGGDAVKQHVRTAPASTCLHQQFQSHLLRSLRISQQFIRTVVRWSVARCDRVQLPLPAIKHQNKTIKCRHYCLPMTLMQSSSCRRAAPSHRRPSPPPHAHHAHPPQPHSSRSDGSSAALPPALPPSNSFFLSSPTFAYVALVVAVLSMSSGGIWFALMSGTPPVPSLPLVHNPYPTSLPLPPPPPHFLPLADNESLLAYDSNFSHAAARLPPPAAPQPPPHTRPLSPQHHPPLSQRCMPRLALCNVELEHRQHKVRPPPCPRSNGSVKLKSHSTGIPLRLQPHPRAPPLLCHPRRHHRLGCHQARSHPSRRPS